VLALNLIDIDQSVTGVPLSFLLITYILLVDIILSPRVIVFVKQVFFCHSPSVLWAIPLLHILLGSAF
jgi:hypothetical protein